MGEIVALTAAFCWGVAPLFDKKAMEFGLNPIIANVARLVFAGIALTVFLAFRGKVSDLITIELTPLRYLVISGILAGGIGMVLYFAALGLVGAARTVPLTSVYPLVTVIFAALVLGEKVGLQLYVGAAFIVAGVCLVSLA